jgi:hypothetical protein
MDAVHEAIMNGADPARSYGTCAETSFIAETPLHIAAHNSHEEAAQLLGYVAVACTIYVHMEGLEPKLRATLVPVDRQPVGGHHGC